MVLIYSFISVSEREETASFFSLEKLLCNVVQKYVFRIVHTGSIRTLYTIQQSSENDVDATKNINNVDAYEYVAVLCVDNSIVYSRDMTFSRYVGD